MNKNKNKGFTLIEILVVVLIIGILAAISVVQYQKSVLKSRFTALMPIAKALYESEELFAMSRGSYTDKLENLDMSTTSDASGSTANINGSIVTLGVNNRHTYVKATRENFDNNLIMFQKGSKYFPGEIHCEAKEDKILANWLCKNALNGKKVSGANDGRSLTEGYTDYVINGEENGFFPKNFFDLRGKYVNGVLVRKEISNGDSCIGTIDYGCNYVQFSNDSSCIGEPGAGWACIGSIFSNSICEVKEGADTGCERSKFFNSICEGNNNHDCIKSEFTDSSCIANSKSTAACQDGNFNNSTCEGNGESSCGVSDFTESKCVGNATYACSGGSVTPSTFSKSSCEGNSGLTCDRAIFSNQSSCTGNHKASCTNSTFENSTCTGNADTSCVGGTFKENSICYANVSGSCGDGFVAGKNVYSTYEGNACCKGKHCPANAPKCDCAIDANTGQHALSC